MGARELLGAAHVLATDDARHVASEEGEGEEEEVGMRMGWRKKGGS